MGLFTTDQTKSKKKAKSFRDLIRQEAILGGTVFGPVPQGVRREFFCLDETTWVWHEEWVDKLGKRNVQTTRYDVRPNGIVKCQNDGHYKQVSPAEAKNLLEAAKNYKELVKTKLYSKQQDYAKAV